MINHTIAYNDRIGVSEELEFHTFDEFEKLEKFIGETPVDFRTSFSKDGDKFKAHSHGHFEGVDYIATASTDDMYKSIDLLVEKLEAQLRKEKGKRTSIVRDTLIAESDEDEEIED
ncbi:putative sigma 54 modulation protein [Erwinia phage pEa_SNUABM_50]|uniref:Sigma 54 modulation protein/ribosomal protein S30EA n=4 Tax=Eneladusvirus BF TaxID=2560751 RepID=A0A1S6UAH3_9CAUD|nr:sigma 54 modulation protein/ribosomal protein S30EA [Serratia phage BF]QOI71123.1 putative sigma 54 modulation protein [Erwinia phage pEa_SNUABM_12]QOI71667.1 putative sigma 54 modulation protein/ribosomal protein [Erwinia phage pEa_SNUABM_47]QOI72206.1 putative sigma 54 modulation protein [Erwinia phage pEa_SNUABM_50]QXO11332.1 hypothetical protein pEaSNUABM19_00186 [Erwinia phage pEa_SNUABM_19]QXO11880.1 hypothetical protein pEaSNUABM44_00184 [Erwinia phage pEa_SNUABM_44]QXO12432.1 hypot